MHYKGFKDLNCYIKARELRIYISVLSKKLPTSEKYLLSQQIIDCSRSITRNIAEGYGRFTYSDTRHFFIIARGSVTETMEQLVTGFDEGYFSEEELKTAELKCELVFKLLNGYIGYLDRLKTKNAQPIISNS